MISVSYLKSVYDFEKTINLLDDIKGIDYIHLDLMDGKYVSENNIDIIKIKEGFKNISKPKDIHLMVSDPLLYINDLKEIKPDIITFHPDAVDDPMKVINTIKELDIKVGIAINYDVDVEEYEKLYKYADNILIMSVQAGYGGQEFKKDVISKIEYFTNLKDDGEEFLLEIDGGINADIYHKLQKYPIDIFVIGAYICTNENFERPLKKILN